MQHGHSEFLIILNAMKVLVWLIDLGFMFTTNSLQKDVPFAKRGLIQSQSPETLLFADHVRLDIGSHSQVRLLASSVTREVLPRCLGLFLVTLVRWEPIKDLMARPLARNAL